MKKLLGLGILVAIVGGVVGAATARTLQRPVRVCCRAVLPAKGDTVRLAVICADLPALDSGRVQIGSAR